MKFGRNSKAEKLGLYLLGYRLLHHWLVAATIAAFTLAVEWLPLFSVIDTATRVMMAFIHAGLTEKRRAERYNKEGLMSIFWPAAAGDRPLVLIFPQIIDQARLRFQSIQQFNTGIIRALVERLPDKDNQPDEGLGLLALDLLIDPWVDDPILNDQPCGAPSPYIDEFPRKAPPPPPPGLPPPPPPQHDGETEPPPSQIEGKWRKWSPEQLPSWDDLRKKALEERHDLNSAIAAVSKKTRVVITAPPLPLNEDEISDWERKYGYVDYRRVLFRQVTWMWEMCRIDNLWMALRVQPEDLEDQIILYNQTTAYLGNVAARAHDGLDSTASHTATDICAALRQEPNPPTSETCPKLLDRITAKADPSSPIDHALLNPNFYDTLSYRNSIDTRMQPPFRTIASLLPDQRALKKKALFVGDDSMLAKTWLQARTPIIDAEAAIFYSNWHGYITNPVPIFIIDSGIGIILGFLFAYFWQAYVHATECMNAARSWQKVKFWVWARLILLPWNLVLLLIVVVATFWLSNMLFRLGTWINPLPLVVGMSIKGLLSSRQHHVDGHAPQSLSEFINRHPDVFLQLLVIFIVLIVLFLKD